MTLPNDISRCSNERCEKKLKCKRYLDCLPFEVYSYSEFDEKDCEYFIETELKKREIMKAKEYFNQFLNENQDKLVEWRLINAFRQMVLEVEQIAKMRNVKSGTALISIFKEIETKSHSFIRLVNETEPFKTEGTVKYDAFKLFVEQSSPNLAAAVWRS